MSHIFTNIDLKTKIIAAYSVIIMLSGFCFNTPSEIYKGMISIVFDRSILVSDYMLVANVGTAFFNCGLLMSLMLLFVKLSKSEVSGAAIAAIFTVGGFAFFGKNIVNITPILVGVYLYTIYVNKKFNEFIIVAAFGTGLAPLTSQIAFGLDLPFYIGLISAFLSGALAGFILPPLAASFAGISKGFNLYHVGFTIGVVGTLFMSFIRSFGMEIEERFNVFEGGNLVFASYLIILFCSMILLGYILNGRTVNGYKSLLRHSGKLPSDFVELDGFPIAIMNMGILGLLSVLYVLCVGGEINGPIIGGIFTVTGFAAFGKHPRNALPIIAGVFIAGVFKIWDVNAPLSILAALFGTTLAPIPGHFGWKTGIIAGFIHLALVMNVGYLHGGMSLYNNGLSGGIVAMVMIPLIDLLHPKKNLTQNATKIIDTD